MADNHVKPTSEELEAKSLEALEELEATEEKEVEDVAEVVKEVEEVEETHDEPEEKDSVEKSDEKSDETGDEEVQDEEDYKEKFIQSTREAQVLFHKNKKLNDAMDQANQVLPPTDEELKKEYSDWDIMSDFEKKMGRESLVNTRRFNAIDEVVKDSKREEAWKSKIDTFLDDPTNLVKNPALEGKQDDFKSFASKPSRRGLDFEDLIASYLYKADQAKPKKKKGSSLLSKSTSQKIKPKSGKLTSEQGRALRETDYSKWKEMLKADKIESI